MDAVRERRGVYREGIRRGGGRSHQKLVNIQLYFAHPNIIGSIDSDRYFSGYRTIPWRTRDGYARGSGVRRGSGD